MEKLGFFRVWIIHDDVSRLNL
uniref:Uncharacterized protein n=1 Tax=Vitis vinifera TaxID=29760 RepID=F6HA69_VITVI